MGLSILIEVTGFTFMAFFISRIGATPVAGHQIAVNMVSLMFMLPLSIANASSTLVAQRIGAGDAEDANRIGWAGLELGVLIAAVLGSAVYLLREPLIGLYTSDPVIIAAALPLLAWVVLFHVADAAQTIAAFVLRAHRIATVPLVVYVVAIWVIGLGGGYVVGVRPRRRPGLAARRPGLLVDGDARRRTRRRLPGRLPRLDAAKGARRGAPASARRQREPEAGAAAFARLAAHAAAVPLGDLLDQRQAEADAAGLLGMARAGGRTARRSARASPPARRRRGRRPGSSSRRPAPAACSTTVISPPP